MTAASKRDHTPSEVLFSTLKRKGGIPHQELASLILSTRPLNDGRSPIEHAKDRTWLSHVIVHAPIGAQQERYFLDYGMAATRVMARLRSKRNRSLDAAEILEMLRGESCGEMERALALCHQNPDLYTNYLSRIADQKDLTLNERAKLGLVLFVAAGCSASSKRAVEYVRNYTQTSSGPGTNTPQAMANGTTDGGDGRTKERPQTLGLLRVEDERILGEINWLDPDGRVLTIGALALGDGDVTDVGVDVSAEHAHIWRDDERGWLVEDLGSTNGTRLTDALSGKTVELTPGEPVPLNPGDELTLAGSTTFVVVEGQA